jgi:tRNA A22 N-methylase
MNKELDEFLSNEKNRKLVYEKLSSKMRLLVDPERYATEAIVVIEDQLTRVKSPKRKAKLENKLSQWKKTIEVLNEEKEDGRE